MKNIKDLNSNECIHCPTEEIFEKLVKLSGNDLPLSKWDMYNEDSVLYPKNRGGKGEYGSIGYAKKCNYTIFPHTDFLFTPKEGDMVMTESGERIYLFTDKNGRHICVDGAYESCYKEEGKGYNVITWSSISTIPLRKKITIEQAEEMLGGEYEIVK